jgi:cytochrome P450
VVSSFFHRDPTQVPDAHRLAPAGWAAESWAPGAGSLIPFSAGPAACPGRDVVLLVAAAVLRRLNAAGVVEQVRGATLCARSPLPVTLDHTALCFRLPIERAADILDP